MADMKPSVVLNKVRENSLANFLVLMLKKSVMKIWLLLVLLILIKVTRSALQNAASVASLLLTTECMIAETKRKKHQLCQQVVVTQE